MGLDCTQSALSDPRCHVAPRTCQRHAASERRTFILPIKGKANAQRQRPTPRLHGHSDLWRPRQLKCKELMALENCVYGVP